MMSLDRDARLYIANMEDLDCPQKCKHRLFTHVTIFTDGALSLLSLVWQQYVLEAE